MCNCQKETIVVYMNMYGHESSYLYVCTCIYMYIYAHKYSKIVIKQGKAMNHDRV